MDHESLKARIESTGSNTKSSTNAFAKLLKVQIQESLLNLMLSDSQAFKLVADHIFPVDKCFDLSQFFFNTKTFDFRAKRWKREKKKFIWTSNSKHENTFC